MKRTERKIYTRCIAIMAVYIIAGVYFYTLPCDAKFAPLEAFEETDGNFTEETEKVAKTGQIREDTGISGMPCESPEQFARFLETYEQETSEEVDDGERQEDRGEVPECETYCEVSETETETVQEVLLSAPTIYSFGEEMIEPYLQVMLYEALDRHGISYWYEIALCEMWQESHGDIYAVNPRNNEDMGVMQYKIRYWDWSLGDIFSPEAQLELYATQMANRLNQGLSADECISRHITSDYCTEMDWQYVSDVKQHLPNLRKVKS